MSTSPSSSPVPTASSSSSSSAMPPPPRPSTSSPSPVPVFAPKPLRLPSNYLPQRGVIPMPRTPSPAPRPGRSSRSGSIAEIAEGDYSSAPSHDVLDDFLSLVRSQSSRDAAKGRPSVSPLSFRQGHRKQWSGSSDGNGEKLAIPASPVSRALTRNPMIYNSQFGLVQEES
ncbi:hypothetical protein K440DRAFT_627128 [Wilcoxina mikolae CBS 423.85]|nr:hypothetical protein K440DRAFT_627128 [Wilcoxina mikolae CBS 423.85]